MAGNSEKVDEIINEAATTQQYKTLVTQVDDLDAHFIKLTNDVLAFTKAAGDSKGFSDFSKNAAQAIINSEKMIQIQNQSIITNAKAEAALKAVEIAQNRKLISDNALAASNTRAAAAQEKATQNAQKALSPYTALSKELDKQRLAAKDLGVQYGLNDPKFLKAQQSVLKLDGQLKKLDSSLGQNQRNVGNYSESVKSALESFYSELDRVIPGAGNFTRTVVEGFGKIGESIRGAKGDVTNFTQGGFGFKPVEAGAPTTISNTTETTANTEAVAANTAANEANAASEVEKGKATKDATVVTEESNAATTEGTGALGLLGEGFTAFTTVAFIAAIGAATYYLSQFKSTANTVSTNLAGLKNIIGTVGGNIVNKLFGDPTEAEKQRKQLLASMSILERIKFEFTHSSVSSGDVTNAFGSGKAAEAAKIQLANIDELEEAENASLAAEAERNRALSKDKLTDIAIRKQYLKDAQGIEQKILDNQKANADKTIETAIALSQKLKKLNPDQLKALRNQDPNKAFAAAQGLALNGQQFTNEGLELFKQGIQKKIAYQQGATNELIRLQADADNLELRGDNALSKAEDALQTERLARAQARVKLELDSETIGARDKLKINQDYVQASIALIKQQEKTELDNAGIGSARAGTNSAVEEVNRLRIVEKTAAEIDKVKAEGLKNQQALQKQINDEVTKDYKQRLQFVIDGEKTLIQAQKAAGDERLLAIDKNYSDEEKALADKYKAGILSAEQYNAQITALDQQTQIAKARSNVQTATDNLTTQSVGLVAGGSDPKDVQAAADALTKAKIAASDLETKIEVDNIKKVETAENEAYQLKLQLISQGIDLFKSLVDDGYQVELDALKKQSDAIDGNATDQKAAVDRALLSSKQKAEQDRVIDAEATASKKQIAAQEAVIKTKQAEFDKAISLASILEQTGAAEVGALKYLADPVTAFLYPEIAALIGALGLLQLTKVAATPVPKYAKGTDYHRGGLGVVGDAGYEYIKLPDGNSFLSPDKPTLMDLPIGASVTPHFDTVKMLQKMSYTSSQTNNNRNMERLLAENNRYQKKLVDKPSRDVAADLIRAQKIINRQNSYFK